MQPGDIPAVIELEKNTLTAWSQVHLEDEFRQPAGFQFAAVDPESGKLLGVLIGRLVVDEGEILKLTVDRSIQRQGIGVHLLNHGLEYCRQHDVRRCYLELRASNQPARRLYEKCGFSAASIRKNYYNSPREDAVLMQLEL